MAVARTWPWEFDAYDWLHTTSRLDNPDWPTDADAPAHQDTETELADAPEFEAYSPQGSQAANDQTAELAQSIAEQLRLPKHWMLFVISI